MLSKYIVTKNSCGFQLLSISLSCLDLTVVLFGILSVVCYWYSLVLIWCLRHRWKKNTLIKSYKKSSSLVLGSCRYFIFALIECRISLCLSSFQMRSTIFLIVFITVSLGKFVYLFITIITRIPTHWAVLLPVTLSQCWFGLALYVLCCICPITSYFILLYFKPLPTTYLINLNLIW